MNKKNGNNKQKKSLHNDPSTATKLGPIQITPKTGKEEFNLKGTPIGKTVLDFWRWASSDFLSNTMRGVLAEYLVASDLGLVEGARAGWDSWDLMTGSGIKVEVKSSAYCQSWKQEKLSSIVFGIAPTYAWDEKTNLFSDEKKRQADVYVFCVLKHRDQETIDPIKVEQWDFYVLATEILNEHCPEQKSLGLNSLLRLEPEHVQYGEIGTTIEKIIMKKSRT